jgi:Helitron helicase-like domain at N-terminus
MSKTNVQASYSTWPATKELLESLTAEEIIEAANKAQQYKPNDDHRIKELLKMLSRIGSTASGSDEKKSYMLAQLKSSMMYYECPILYVTINPAERYSPISLFYAGEKIDVKNFSAEFHTYSERLKCMLNNPLPVVEYFHDLVTTIIETVLKGGMFGELNHYYGTIEYQGRYTPHIHMAVLAPYLFFISVVHCF